jgi:hypothetical protein
MRSYDLVVRSSSSIDRKRGAEPLRQLEKRSANRQGDGRRVAYAGVLHDSIRPSATAWTQPRQLESSV